MDISATSRSIDNVNKLLQNMTSKSVEFAEKMVKLNAEMALGKEANKGQNLDVTG